MGWYAITKEEANTLAHSTGPWKKHKYIKIVDGRYFYPGDNLGNKKKRKGAAYSEYSDNDPDFDEKNYNEKNRLGDTDFYAVKKSDGSYVIIEEDMKWTLPKGTKITPELVKKLENMPKAKSNDEFVKNTTDILDKNSGRKIKDVVSDTKEKGKDFLKKYGIK